MAIFHTSCPLQLASKTANQMVPVNEPAIEKATINSEAADKLLKTYEQSGLVRVVNMRPKQMKALLIVFNGVQIALVGKQAEHRWSSVKHLFASPYTSLRAACANASTVVWRSRAIPRCIFWKM